MNIKRNLIAISMVLVATLPAVAQWSSPALPLEQSRRWQDQSIIIEQSSKSALDQRTDEILNDPRPGDRIMKDGPGDQDYYYYDGGRWNKHRDIWRNGNEAEKGGGNDPGLFDGND